MKTLDLVLGLIMMFLCATGIVTLLYLIWYICTRKHEAKVDKYHAERTISSITELISSPSLTSKELGSTLLRHPIPAFGQSLFKAVVQLSNPRQQERVATVLRQLGFFISREHLPEGEVLFLYTPQERKRKYGTEPAIYILDQQEEIPAVLVEPLSIANPQFKDTEFEITDVELIGSPIEYHFEEGSHGHP